MTSLLPYNEPNWSVLALFICYGIVLVFKKHIIHPSLNSREFTPPKIGRGFKETHELGTYLDLALEKYSFSKATLSWVKQFLERKYLTNLHLLRLWKIFYYLRNNIWKYTWSACITFIIIKIFSGTFPCQIFNVEYDVFIWSKAWQRSNYSAVHWQV